MRFRTCFLIVVLLETRGSNWLEFCYDESGRPYALNYNGVVYYYITNLQGDVVKISNPTGSVVAEYSYNAWGELLSATGTMASVNPLRYRGYYYDSESGLYYLKSRYYDPALCRFINADGAVSTGQGFTGCNMFAYCTDNPVNGADPNGQWMWYIDTDGNLKASELPYYKGYDLIIYYFNLSSSENLNTPAFNQSYSSKARYVPAGSFTELTNALENTPIGIRNIFLYLHSEPGHLVFYYDLNYDSDIIEREVPMISISGDVYLFSCHGASIAGAFSKATGQTVVATPQAVSFTPNGKARMGYSSYIQDRFSLKDTGWYSFSSDDFSYYCGVTLNLK